MRYETEKTDVLNHLEKKIAVYYTGRKSKRNFLKREGIYPTIWIDDRPDYIINDA